jgi:hypothetical protein
MTTVKDAIRAAPDRPMACWMPRHVLRVTKGGRTIDLVICFECRRYGVRSDDSPDRGSSGGRVSPDGQPTLDRILTAAGVPLAPKLGV